MDGIETSGPVVETAQGKVRGGIKDGIHFFKGLHYGGTTAGKNRFLAPPPPERWTGIREALTFGPRAPQVTEPYAHLAWRSWIRDTGQESEDCLLINIYTPGVNDNARRPVMVYIHGGNFATGSGSPPGLDGTNLAKRGDVVVVTLNHRLNLFGYLYLGDGDGGRWQDSANAGMLDLIAALEWVRDNIAALGGDPGCVTLFGQSGGGSKVSMLTAMPGARGLFHRAICQSPAGMYKAFDPDFAEGMTRRLFDALGMDRNKPAALQDLSVEQLMEGRRKSGLSHGSMRPVRDGRHLPHHPFYPVAAPTSKDIPMMAGSTDTEATFYLTMDPANFTMDEAQACLKLQQVMDVDEAGGRQLMAEFRKRRPGATPFELLLAIQSRQTSRRGVSIAAQLKSAQGGAPIYVYEFAWASPVEVEGGVRLNSPHTICIPFVFGNVDAAAAMVGTGPDSHALSQRMMDTWVQFARTGNPNHSGIPEWIPFDCEERHMLVFDNECRSVKDRGREDRLALEAYPRFTPEKGAKRQR